MAAMNWAPRLCFLSGIDALAGPPGAGQAIGLRGARRIVINAFKYSLFYRVEGEVLRIYAVAHTGSGPGTGQRLSRYSFPETEKRWG